MNQTDRATSQGMLRITRSQERSEEQILPLNLQKEPTLPSRLILDFWLLNCENRFLLFQPLSLWQIVSATLENKDIYHYSRSLSKENENIGLPKQKTQHKNTNNFFTITQDQKPSRCLPKRMDKRLYIHMMGCHSALKRNRLLMYATTWLKFRNFVQSEATNTKEYV